MATNRPIKEWLRLAGPVGLSFIVLAGCGFLSGRDSDIKSSTRAIETARDDVQRAKAYSRRGTAYSEKARYSRVFKLIPADEYERLFDLAVKDHDQAIALNPGSTEAYSNRGQTYYDRGWLDLTDHQDGKPWFGLAAVDFEKATEKDPRDYMAIDRLGLAHEENGETDKAIRDYMQELALNPRLGRVRLADAYCNWGVRLHQQKNYDAAVVEYLKSIEVGATPDDGCECEPYTSLFAIYAFQSRQYDRAWELVHQAEKSKRRIDRELVDQLKKETGRNE